MKEYRNYQLKGNNTFGIPALCDRFIEYAGGEELKSLYEQGIFNGQWMSVGCGANLLFCGDYHGVIIHSVASGIKVLEENDNNLLVRADAGIILDDFIEHAVSNGWGGMENLSAIPCSVGAAPVQNVGAYGVEAKDVVECVHVFDTSNGLTRTFSNVECTFGYRNSSFKSNPQYVVLSVDFRLTKAGSHQLHLDYGNLRSSLPADITSGKEGALREIRGAVRRIRREKLPDPAEIGSAGSFFKNPVVDRAVVDNLLKDYPQMPFYEMKNGCKVPAGWLIEQAGWKGRKMGTVGVYEKQALVLVNLGGATGFDVWNLAQSIVASIRDKFGLEISPEVIKVP
ncbi:MAG: UDP-N-acetylmuramate dehydrogenase [Paludibacteraceae bacterium]|nr:UDP-N-acetylmuramate dehydrogenase [Paludibacteraceae bacterium]